MKPLFFSLLFIPFFTTAFATETLVRMECANMVIERDGDHLLITRGKETYILGGGEPADLTVIKLIEELEHRDKKSTRFHQLTVPNSTEPLAHTTKVFDEALGENTFTPEERHKIETLRDEINALTLNHIGSVSQRARDIKTETKVPLAQAKREAPQSLAGDANHMWEAFEIRKKRVELFSIYADKLKPLGVDLHGDSAKVDSALQALSPFDHIRPSLRSQNPPFPFGRGESFDVKFNVNHMRRKYEKHVLEEGQLREGLTFEEFLHNARALAESKNPRLISFAKPGAGSNGGSLHIKFDPETEEMIVIGDDRQFVVSYYQKGDPPDRNIWERVLINGMGTPPSGPLSQRSFTPDSRRPSSAAPKSQPDVYYKPPAGNTPTLRAGPPPELLPDSERPMRLTGTSERYAKLFKDFPEYKNDRLALDLLQVLEREYPEHPEKVQAEANEALKKRRAECVK